MQKVLLLCVLVVLVACATADWSAFGGNSAHTGFVPARLLRKHYFEIVWNVTLGVPLASSVECQGRVLVTGAGNLFVLDSVSGKQVRGIFVGAGSFLGPAACSNEATIAFTQGVTGFPQGVIFNAFDYTSGQQLWTSSASSLWASFPYGVTAGNNGIVYAPAGTYLYSEMVYALSQKDGSTLFSVQAMPSGSDNWTPTFDGTDVYANSDTYLSKLDGHNGTVLWTINLNSGKEHNARWVSVVSGSTVYGVSIASSYQTLAAVDTTTGKARWGSPCRSPSFVDGYPKQDYSVSTDGVNVFMACADAIHRIDSGTGIVLSTYPCNQCGGQPLITADAVVVNSKEGIQIFNKASGKIEYTLNGVSGYLSYSSGLLIVTGFGPNGQVTALKFA